LAIPVNNGKRLCVVSAVAQIASNQLIMWGSISSSSLA